MKTLLALITLSLAFSASAEVQQIHCTGHLTEIMATFNSATMKLTNVKYFEYYQGETTRASAKSVETRYKTKREISYDLPMVEHGHDSTWLNFPVKALTQTESSYTSFKGTLVTEASCTEEIFKAQLTCYFR